MPDKPLNRNQSRAIAESLVNWQNETQYQHTPEDKAAVVEANLVVGTSFMNNILTGAFLAFIGVRYVPRLVQVFSVRFPEFGSRYPILQRVSSMQPSLPTALGLGALAGMLTSRFSVPSLYYEALVETQKTNTSPLSEQIMQTVIRYAPESRAGQLAKSFLAEREFAEYSTPSTEETTPKVDDGATTESESLGKNETGERTTPVSSKIGKNNKATAPSSPPKQGKSTTNKYGDEVIHER